ncbi:hypothetical protein KKB64_05205 [Patescibacteria group bacterium]|nr:hypothetical protein [Patescibacteria group bacterium]MBU1473150.1 hypothetical protein [Patescibacteria group bacterium]MBU2459541.1 hypothetical protein [Patescibacteria group bacterium]MBU2544533.1 hypothetical protein [Patescibacteria group bacterium]
MKDPKPSFIRERMITSVRKFFSIRKFHEVITPVLSSSLPLEPNVHAFRTVAQTTKGASTHYLATSPESGIKKMIAAGIGNCFAISKSFRNLEGLSRWHRPEFIMLEWYREGATQDDIVADVRALMTRIKTDLDRYLHRPESDIITYQGRTIRLGNRWPKVSLRHLFASHAKVSLDDILDDRTMVAVARKKGYSTDHATWEQMFHQIFLNEIEQHVGDDPCFVVDFPSRVSPLAARRKDNPSYAQRFEFYMGGLETGNGNTENTNIKEIRNMMEVEQENRNASGATSPPIDEDFLNALYSMKDTSYAGVGLGIDRLTMIFADVSDIGYIDPLIG